MQAWREGTRLENDPAGTMRRQARYTREEITEVTDRLASVPPSER